MVRAVPFCSPVVLAAINVENIGESATTVAPQKMRNKINTAIGKEKLSGDIMQQQHEHSNAMNAVFLTPVFCEKYPLAIQEIVPLAITTKEINETDIFSTLLYRK